MLRLAGAAVDFSTFQDDFDLQIRNIALNNFGTVSEAVMQRYPAVCIHHRSFPKGQGAQKLADCVRSRDKGSATRQLSSDLR